MNPSKEKLMRPEEQITLISSLIGKKINNAVTKDAAELKCKYKRINYLSSYEAYHFVVESNLSFVTYLRTV